jgi:HlyD family secretion protein
VDTTTRTTLVYVDLPTDSAARAGMFATGTFELGKVQALTLPQSAVVMRDGFDYVYRVSANNHALQTKVGVGRRIGDRVEITAGLQPDTRVVSAGGGFLTDGDLLRVVPMAGNAQ